MQASSLLRFQLLLVLAALVWMDPSHHDVLDPLERVAEASASMWLLALGHAQVVRRRCREPDLPVAEVFSIKRLRNSTSRKRPDLPRESRLEVMLGTSYASGAREV